jgi:two-component system, sensor histidine kinase RegB
VAKTDDKFAEPGPERSPGAVAIRVETLVRVRWFFILGQGLFVYLLNTLGGVETEYVTIVLILALAGIFNVLLYVRLRDRTQVFVRDALFQLSFDQVQLSVLLIASGGLVSPLSVLYLLPLIIAAMSMDRRASAGIFALTLLASALVGLHSGNVEGLGAWMALVFASSLAWYYVVRVGIDITQRDDALAAAQSALEAEQRLAALGALATAAAHELGTPLGTITLAAREVMGDMDASDPHHGELEVIAQEALRCREILQRLSATHGDEREDLLRRLPIEVLVQQAIDNHNIIDRKIIVKLQPGDGGHSTQPMVSNRAEIIHGLGNFIENAVGFSRETIEILISWNHDVVRVTILDDGPGFDSDVVHKLGQPYISTRADAGEVKDESGAGGLGLGVFIAKTLIERTGGEVKFHNGVMGGAQIDVIWPRAVFEEMNADISNSGGLPEALQ